MRTPLSCQETGTGVRPPVTATRHGIPPEGAEVAGSGAEVAGSGAEVAGSGAEVADSGGQGGGYLERGGGVGGRVRDRRNRAGCLEVGLGRLNPSNCRR